MKRVSYGTYSLIFDIVYLGLSINLLVAVACLPEILLLLGTNPASSWPLCALVAPLVAPAMTASFTAFRERDDRTSIFRSFVRGWRKTWRRALLLGAIVSVGITVLLVDAWMFANSTAGVVLIPVLAVLTIVLIAVGVVSLVAISEAPQARLRDVVRASAYLVVRRWYVTVGTLIVLALHLVLFAKFPVLALAISPAPALYLAWANGRYTLGPVLEDDRDTVASPAASIPSFKEMHQ